MLSGRLSLSVIRSRLPIGIAYFRDDLPRLLRRPVVLRLAGATPLWLPAEHGVPAAQTASKNGRHAHTLMSHDRARRAAALEGSIWGFLYIYIY